MSRTIMLIPVGNKVGLTTIRLGIIHAMKKKGIRLFFFRTISEPNSSEKNLNKKTATIDPAYDLLVVESLTKISHVESFLRNNKKDVLMEEIIARCYQATTNGAEIVLVEGVISTCKEQFSQLLNFEIAKTLNAEIVFVISQESDTLERLKERIELIQYDFSSLKNTNIVGVIINKLNEPIDAQRPTFLNLFKITEKSLSLNEATINPTKLQDSISIPVLGIIPWNLDLLATRAIDIAHYTDATIINAGDINSRRIRSIIFCTQSMPFILEHLKEGSLLITSTDRSDILVASCLAAMNGIKIGAILLTGGYEIDHRIKKLCKQAFSTGLPVFMVNANTWKIPLNLQSLNLEIAINDHQRIKKTQEYVAGYIKNDWINSLITHSKQTHYLSPPAFRYQLTELARKANKRVVLPEGDEPRTIKAASICAKRNIATCILLGDPDKINKIASCQGVRLSSSSIEIMDPKIVRNNYVSRLLELRKHKGMTEIAAYEEVKDNVVLGTLMLEKDEVDGLVSGAVHTTANTVRPPLQLIKTAPNTSLVSSVFFMLLPEQVYVYGDCAINLNPTAKELAEIAIQSAESAIIFGIEPRVAMLSYSTGTSGFGEDVEKVRRATYIAKKKRPDLIIDGPLQYDAAVIPDVAQLKAPDSPVAGRATVFIFPDLNTGNTTYKAVQRSANLISIGPMLQGMRKPVNDLSRGALVDDIVYTIAITAIQSSKQSLVKNMTTTKKTNT